MARPPNDTRRSILRAAYEKFYRAGFARVSVDEVAAAAGVTKKTLYYHFPSKDALAGAVLDDQHAYALQQFQRWAGARTAGPARFADEIFRNLGRWAAKPGWTGAGFTRITMELADLPGHPARVAARRHKRLVEDWLAAEFEARGVRESRAVARRIHILLEGCMAAMLIHGDVGYAEAAAAAARSVIDAAGTVKGRQAPSAD